MSGAELAVALPMAAEAVGAGTAAGAGAGLGTTAAVGGLGTAGLGTAGGLGLTGSALGDYALMAGLQQAPGLLRGKQQGSPGLPMSPPSLGTGLTRPMQSSTEATPAPRPAPFEEIAKLLVGRQLPSLPGGESLLERLQQMLGQRRGI